MTAGPIASIKDIGLWRESVDLEGKLAVAKDGKGKMPKGVCSTEPFNPDDVFNRHQSASMSGVNIGSSTPSSLPLPASSPHLKSGLRQHFLFDGYLMEASAQHLNPS